MSDSLDLNLFTNSWNEVKACNLYKEDLIGVNFMVK